MGRAHGPTVLVAGLGDLGGRTLEMLAGHPRVGRLVGCGSASARSAGLVAQAALIADTLGGPDRVDHEPVDLSDQDSVADCLTRVAPDVVVFAASRHSWWRTPTVARSVPYGIWLPLQIALLHTFMRAHRDTGSTSVVVALPHPDVAGPVLAAEGLAPHTGAGNVAEVAAKLRLLAAAQEGCAREEVTVRLVLHHAAERLAFPLFDYSASGSTAGVAATAPARPPYVAEVTVRGERMATDVVDGLLSGPYPLVDGTGSHQLTAATTARLVDALLGDEPQSLHVPSPAGLPGGYPVLVGRGSVEVDLPPTISLADAVSVNERAAVFDGIRAIGPDGTVHYSDEARATAREVLHLSLEDIPLSGLTRAAARLDTVLLDHPLQR